MSTPAPPAGPLSGRLYDRLPLLYRDADPGTGFTLLRFLAAVLGPADAVETLADRFDYIGPAEGGDGTGTSDLVDPQTADEAWLPWLGQLVGVQPNLGLTGQALRDAVGGATAGWRGGTAQAIADAARSALTDTRYVRVYSHSTSTGSGGPWDILLVTRLSETPSSEAVLQAVRDKHAKPAGVRLWHRPYGASWATLQEAYPTWQAWDVAAGSWVTLEETGAPVTG